jgi:hypothetical protein
MPSRRTRFPNAYNAKLAKEPDEWIFESVDVWFGAGDDRGAAFTSSFRQQSKEPFFFVLFASSAVN